jgi:glycosyltransferase involved in cell wall biosynthesis
MNVEVHLFCHNDAEILPYTLRHYRTFADSIIVHDSRGTDGTRDIAVANGAKVVDWPITELDDIDIARMKSICWRGTTADWVIVADADELIYFPETVGVTLRAYLDQGLAVVKPYGWEMTCEQYPTTELQIYHEVKMGARDDYWYAKPILFRPARVDSINFDVGAHSAEVIDDQYAHLQIDRNWPFAHPPTYLLHFHQIGPIERIARRYDETRLRLSQRNVDLRLGNLEAGIKHAQDKRAMILSKLERVIA